MFLILILGAALSAFSPRHPLLLQPIHHLVASHLLPLSLPPFFGSRPGLQLCPHQLQDHFGHSGRRIVVVIVIGVFLTTSWCSSPFQFLHRCRRLTFSTFACSYNFLQVFKASRYCETTNPSLSSYSKREDLLGQISHNHVGTHAPLAHVFQEDSAQKPLKEGPHTSQKDYKSSITDYVCLLLGQKWVLRSGSQWFLET